ncbi:winged helix-turn-helix transcriptional regulator [Streptomyces antarcticus]|uniref:winged helix-turn-helix transcriptional regulator n=1 Tax=Streptomyces antarcticus TaxID=2996458 RepID=UPI00226E478A|nr:MULTISPECIES: winged helix-turn-helix transcriptional regulator [unclassified Streptomyces]MCY0940217.1 winged helix-turn-helix transcriptional regulator [Streptomyces sp. H34-AA3]MCZ4080864.1 winged helix-turn-helix transcriptional regulator [Streptomyces sp. H34-S5]
MATTGLPESISSDLSRVTQSLQMLAPRWNVWVLMTLSQKPLRYREIKSALPWLPDGQLHPRLGKLVESGLLERTEFEPQDVLYGLSVRGRELLPVLGVIATWGGKHLEKETVLDPATGHKVPKAVPRAQDVEDTIALIAPRQATPILWALRIRGTSSAKALAATAMPDRHLTNVYEPLNRLAEDFLVAKDREGRVELTAAGRDLAPVYRALSAWAAGAPLTEAASHPVWAPEPAQPRDRPAMWATTQPRIPAVPTTQTRATWKPGDLFFSDTTTVIRPAGAAATGGRTR